MTTETKVTRFIPAKDVVTHFKTLEKAAEEANDYKFMRAGNGIYVCKHGDNAYVIIEKVSPDGVPVIGCSCKAWTHEHDNDGCKHVCTFQKRSRKPAAALDKRTAMDLIAAGWKKNEHGNLYPLSDEEVAAKATAREAEVEAVLDAKWDKEHPETTPDCPERPNEHELKKEAKMTEETQKKKIYTHPDGTEFESAEALLDYVDELKAAQAQTAVTTRGRHHKAMIKGISPQLQEVGRIAVGEKGGRTQSGKSRLPTKLDHFIFTTLEKDEDDRYLRDPGMMELFGDHCTEIPIRLLYNDIELNFPTFYAKYTRSGMKLRGDGENWTEYNDDGTREEVFDPNNERGYLDDPDVKPHGILTVLVEGQNSVGGVFKFRTTSWNSINNILSSLSVIKNMCGMLTYIPLKLVYRKKDVQPVGMAHKTWIPVVSVEFRGSIEELQAQAEEVRNYMTAGQREETKQIEAAVREHLIDDETTEEQKDIAAEFSPGVV